MRASKLSVPLVRSINGWHRAMQKHIFRPISRRSTIWRRLDVAGMAAAYDGIAQQCIRVHRAIVRQAKSGQSVSIRRRYHPAR